MNKIVKPTLYSPAGDISKGLSAIFFGADGIYLGLDKFGLRKTANLDLVSVERLIKYCHKLNKKVDITLNAYLKNDEINDFKNYLKNILLLNPDSIIFSDPSVIILYEQIIEELFNNKTIKKLPSLTLSTQSNTTNYYSMKFWNRHNVKRIVAARELSLEEIFQIKREAIKEGLNFELETFIHGAMCISLSGRCLLSLYMTNKKFSKKGSENTRDANHGECVHPCRFAYLVEQSREGEYFPIEEDGRYTYILSSKDLCLLYYIPLLMFSKIDAFKIEGRMKSSFYTSTITFAYRKAIDKAYEMFLDIELEDKILLYYFKNPLLFLEDFPDWKNFVNEIKIFTELASHRPYTTGFYFNQEFPDYMMPLYESKLIQPYLIVAEHIKNEIDEKNFKSESLETEKDYKIKPDQFIILAKNSIKIENSRLFLFSKNGISEIKNYKIFDSLNNKISLLQHSKYYKIEFDKDFLSLVNLNEDQIFFIFTENKNYLEKRLID